MSKPKSKVITVRVMGPFAPYAPRFTSLLAERGYTPLSTVRQLQVMVHLSQWLRGRDLDVVDLTFALVEEYLAQRRAEGYTAFWSRSGLKQLLDGSSGAGRPSWRAGAAGLGSEHPAGRLCRLLASRAGVGGIDDDRVCVAGEALC